jgi:predicted Ser/Thr protein kinase
VSDPGAQGECLDANVVQAWQAGLLSGQEREETDQHLDACVDCRRLVAALVTGEKTAEGSTPALDSTMPWAGRHSDGLDPGTKIGRFVVRKVLGVGGMGVVYAAEDPELKREVALKLLRDAMASNAGVAARRIFREARLAARVSHPNVVSIYEVGQYEDRVFIAMELVKGHSLTSWLAARPRSLREILEVFVAAGRGLAAAHAAGVVHRDFKPDNVLVGEDGRARVGDFGLARRGDDDGAGTPAEKEDDRERRKRASLSDLSRASAILGTPAYMAPEQHDGAHTDSRTDQFSFCVALYEAVHRQRPFEGKTWEELAEAVKAGHVRPPPATSRVPASLHRIILRGLSVVPGDRFASMEELLAALGRDRGRPLRRWAYTSLVVLVAVMTALLADRVARERSFAVARSSFAAARDQLGRSLRLRYEAFTAMSDLSYVVPVMRQVTGYFDEADFGFGDTAADDVRLATLRENLRSADWILWAKASQQGSIGVADYKGRLLFSGAAPELGGNDVRVLDAVERAYATKSGGASGAHAMVIRGDDPDMVASGLLGGAPRPGLYVVFARTTVLDGVPRAAFILTMEGSRLLDDVSLGGGVQLALLAPDGTADSDRIPPRVIAWAHSASDGMREMRDGGQWWLVESYPVRGHGDDQHEIARIVLAREMDSGLAGLFPDARTVLGALLVLAAVSTAAAALMARSARRRLASAR